MWRERRLRDDERGFSLVELMVVVLVIAVLIGIAVPTFLVARQRADDAVVEMNLRTALVAARVYFLEADTYGVDIEGATTVYVEAHDETDEGDTVIVGGRTNQGKCLYLKEHKGAKQAGTFILESGSGSECPALKPDQLAGLDTVA